jgi:hypothetical protein
LLKVVVVEDVVVQLVEEEAAGAEIKIKVIQQERQQAPVEEAVEHFLDLEDLVERLVHQTQVAVEEVLLVVVEVLELPKVLEAVVGVLLVVAPVEAAAVAVVEPYIETEEVFHTTTIDFMDQ